jgi:hypothetical protein
MSFVIIPAVFSIVGFGLFAGFIIGVLEWIDTQGRDK